jgi:hypothetical protein
VIPLLAVRCRQLDIQIVNKLADAANTGGITVGNLYSKRILNPKDQVDRVDTVIVEEGGSSCDLPSLDVKPSADNFEDPSLNVSAIVCTACLPVLKFFTHESTPPYLFSDTLRYPR